MNKCKLVSSAYSDQSIVFRKDEIAHSYEQDWDDENIYYKVDEKGWITKIHLITGDVYKYQIDRVAH